MGALTALRRLVRTETKNTYPMSIQDEKQARLWSRALGGGYSESAANKIVTVDTAMQLSAVWACVRLISETVATLPLLLYRREAQGGRAVAADHPLYTLLHDTPNADNTSVEFWEGAVLGLCLNGNAYAEKVRIGSRLVALEPMPYTHVSVVRNRSTGAREYRYNDPYKGLRVLSEDDVFHIRGFGNAADVGLSPISFARQTIGTTIATEEATAKLFANGVRPSGVVEAPQVLTAEQRKLATENIIGPMAGSQNAGGVFLLEAGWKFAGVSLAPKDAEMLLTRKWNVEEICRWFNTPPVLIGHSGDGQTMWGSGVEQIMLGWLTMGLRSYLRRIEAAINRSLLPPEERQSIYAEFNVDALLRADSHARADLWSRYSQNGIMTRNEIREKENLPRVEGGDTLTVQSNLLPIDLLGVIAVQPREKPVAPGSADVPIATEPQRQ